MQTRHGIRNTLLALAAAIVLVALAAQGLARVAADNLEIHADAESARVELRLVLFMVCVHFEAGYPDHFAASARLFSCKSGSCLQPQGRWS